MSIEYEKGACDALENRNQQCIGRHVATTLRLVHSNVGRDIEPTIERRKIELMRDALDFIKRHQEMITESPVTRCVVWKVADMALRGGE